MIAVDNRNTFWEHRSRNKFNMSQIFRRSLSNGINVSFLKTGVEPRTVSIRMFFNGGRGLEPDCAVGAFDLGSKTIQEGGAFRDVSREAMELFCLDHMIMLEVAPREDGLIIDLKVNIDSIDQNETFTMMNETSSVSNLEAAFQVMHILMTDFKWEESALKRAKDLVICRMKERSCNLESLCEEEILSTLSSAHCLPSIYDIEKLSLETVSDIMKKQLTPRLLEVAVAGDVSAGRVEQLVLSYLSTVQGTAPDSNKDACGLEGAVVGISLKLPERIKSVRNG